MESSNILPTGEIISTPPQPQPETSVQHEYSFADSDKHGFTLALIQEVKKYPCLFDTKDPQHSNKDYKESIWTHLGRRFRTSTIDVQTRWNSLRRQYRRERMFRAVGYNGHTKPRRSWAFYDYMHFLRNCLNEKRLHPSPLAYDDSRFVETSNFGEEDDLSDSSYLTPNEQISSMLTDTFYAQSGQGYPQVKNEVVENLTDDQKFDFPRSQPTRINNSNETSTNHLPTVSTILAQISSANNYNTNNTSSGVDSLSSADPVTIVSYNGNGSNHNHGSLYSTPTTSSAASTKKPVLSQTTHIDETLDADLAFGRAVGLELQRLDEYQKGVAKIRIQQVLLDARFRTSPNSGT